MNQYIIAFVTGVTTGGLSCLAVQGGLLATSIEKRYQSNLSLKIQKNKNHLRLVAPIIFFLVAKIIAYTLLGFFLGLVGSVFQFSALTRSIMLVAIGVFMVGNALRMLNIHPVFNIFIIEPPKFITKYIRKTSKNDDAFTPLLLGAMTVFIPCGVTQAVIASALATAHPFQAAGLLFSFTLGTSPVFFLISYLTLNIGTRIEALFMRLVAIMVLVLGFVSIDSGLNLMGMPSLQSFLPEKTNQTVSQADTSSTDKLVLKAQNNGYFPEIIYAKASRELTLEIITKNTQSCSRGFVIPALSVEKILPVTGLTDIDIPPQPSGTEIMFTCSMGMYTGKIVFRN